MAQLDILSIGSISIDFIESQVFFGGTAANVAVNCARLGLATGLYSAASSSDWGKRYIDFLHAEDVPFVHPPDILENLPEYHVSLNSDGTTKESVFFDNGLTQAFRSVPQSEIALPPAEIVHFAACEPEFVNKVIKAAPGDQQISYNPGGWLTYDVDYFAAAYPKAHFLFLNAYEYQLHVSANIAHNPLDLLTNDCQVIVITRGSKPVWLVHDGKLAEIPVNQVAAIDETGAGDGFISAFLWGWVNELPVETCVRLGIEFGGLVAQQFGAQASPELIQRFMSLQ
jgi:sugar/nucleoside kinase (ribokinase family)